MSKKDEIDIALKEIKRGVAEIIGWKKEVKDLIIIFQRHWKPNFTSKSRIWTPNLGTWFTLRTIQFYFRKRLKIFPNPWVELVPLFIWGILQHYWLTQQGKSETGKVL